MNIKYIFTVLFLISGTVLPFDVFAEIENETTLNFFSSFEFQELTFPFPL